MAKGSIKEWTCKDGTVHYQITVEGERNTLTGKRNRVYKTVKGSLKEAKSVMHKLITDVENDKYVKPSNKLVGDWVKEWIDTYLPNVEETTRVGYKTKIRCYITPALGEIYIKSLKPEHVQKMINEMIDRGLSAKNIRDTFNNINAAITQVNTVIAYATGLYTNENIICNKITIGNNM
jgi:hypothetical protein